MVVPETMDEELDIEMNPEIMDNAIAVNEQTSQAEGNGVTLLDDGMEKDYETESKDKPQDENDSPTKEEKRLVLEARHSLSIAETKKRRASVYSSESLFIPKELARSDVLHRRGSTLNTLERIAKHQEYCMRMLTFPVGSGRARYVAKQMKKGKRITSKKPTSNANEEPKVKENLPRNMPELDNGSNETNQLQSDDEMSILIFDMVKDLMETKRQDCKEKENTKLSENPQNQRTSVIKINRKLLAEDKDQHNVLFRWHNPNYCDGEIQMRLLNKLDEMKEIPETEVQVNYSEVNNEKTTKSKALEELQQQQQQQQQQQLPAETVNELQSDDNQQQSPLEQNESRPQELEQHQIHTQPQMQLQNPIDQHAAERQQQHVAQVPINRTTAATTNNATSNALLRQQRMHHIVLNDDLYQANGITNSNNALNLTKRNLYAADPLVNQWAHQPYAQQQHRQSPPLMYQQPQLEPLNQLQELKAMHQRLKIQEDEQLNQIGNTLKKVYEERSVYERQHAEENRLFMLKMSQSQKLEEKLQADREKLQRQHKASLSMLEQRIGEKQQQLLQQNWQRQQQTYQQQLMMEQQHFMQQQHQEQIQHQLAQQQQQQQLLHQRFAQQQHARQQLVVQQHARPQQLNQPEHHAFYPPHGYDPHHHAPPSVYKPQTQPQNPPPPPYFAPPPPPPPPPSNYQQHVQSVQCNAKQRRSSEARQSMDDQSRLIPPPIHYHQPAVQQQTSTMPEHSTLLANHLTRREGHRSSENATCQSSRTMRRRATYDYRSLPYVLPSTQNVQNNLNNPQRYPTESSSTTTSGQVPEQNNNRTAITSLMQNYVSNFINDNLRPNG